ncbi:VTT domain-containing protein [Candidatus Formimonas warabiya]|uniref:CRIB domain-containing protein n=1 Tax=Formimonas warabiya TaxID=1761012 RepID=A0A3G1KUE0_FORW1|nr:VTT domain-containing protein [Candidatus Formimonas warabiya]ATW25795.1 hypothetical protein DCMF_14390 [Candidatus Formimonas warabiya]
MDLTNLVNHYGYLVLFTALMLELIAFPLPGEVLMSYAGYLVFQGQLAWFPSIFVSAAGACTGITLSYLIGYRVGSPFLKRYGHYVHVGPEKLEKTSLWFSRYGNRILALAYYIPGVRHVTGYFSGITRISFRKFAVFAYAGAILWAGTFVSLGKILGPRWEHFHDTVKKYLLVGSLILVAVLVAIYLYRFYKAKIVESTLIILQRAFESFHSLGRVKFLIASTSAVFIILFFLMLGLIQDYLANEFQLFNNIVILLTDLIFSQRWSPVMKLFGFLIAPKIFVGVIILGLLWVVIKGKDRMIEIAFILIVVAGGQLFEIGLKLVFGIFGPKELDLVAELINTFPSGETLMVIATYGFVTFLLVRHSKNIWVKRVGPILFFMVSLLVGLSQIFFHTQYPSDVVSGYVFGGVWLSLNIILLEVFRLLRDSAEM